MLNSPISKKPILFPKRAQSIKIIQFLFLSVLLLILPQYATAQKIWKEIITVEDLYNSYPQTILGMLSQYNLDYPGLEKVKIAYNNENMVEASYQLLAYYKNGGMAADLRKELPRISQRSHATTDTILNNVFIVQNVRGKVPFGADGHRNWYYKGPNNDKEWAWLSNRHSQLYRVFNTYLETGNPKYAEYIDQFLRDFIIKSMPYPKVKSYTSVWRGLEVSFRAKVWPKIFYGLLASEYLSPATQLLILASLPDHAHYNRNFHSENNWLTMEISALATIAAYFPEFKASTEWMDYAITTMVQSMKNQVYPDGVQTELSSHYHNVALKNFELFKDICDKANRKLPEFYNQTIEDMYRYISHMVRPSGHRLLNNDGDRGSDRNYILEGAKKFDHPDWEYIATNGQSGQEPTDGPSYFYPWAGHFVSRSGFDANAHWSFFDMGPWGSSHQNSDKLHLSVSAFGKDFLVDAGRFAYTGEVAEKFRPYAQSSAGHNLILIDGKGQEKGPKMAEKPIENNQYKLDEDFDYASSSYDKFIDIEGTINHNRTVFYVRNQFWVVVDRITTDRPRKIDALWHWHPDNIVEKGKNIVKTNNAHGNLAIIPVGKKKLDLEFIKGQESPNIQGWYSPEYNIFSPNVTSKYSYSITGNSTLVWLLQPSDNEMPKVKANIISETDKEIKLMVKLQKEKWQLNIPFNNSSGAKLISY